MCVCVWAAPAHYWPETPPGKRSLFIKTKHAPPVRVCFHWKPKVRFTQNNWPQFQTRFQNHAHKKIQTMSNQKNNCVLGQSPVSLIYKGHWRATVDDQIASWHQRAKWLHREDTGLSCSQALNTQHTTHKTKSESKIIFEFYINIY